MKPREQILWVTAREITKRTDLNKEQLRTLRNNNPSLFKLADTGGYLYNFSMLKDLLKPEIQSL